MVSVLCVYIISLDILGHVEENSEQTGIEMMLIVHINVYTCFKKLSLKCVNSE